MNAFRHGPWEPTAELAAASPSRPLQDLRLAVKAVIDVAGLTTDAGNPAFEASRSPASRDAPCVASLRSAGAHLVGTTITDELAFSLSGTNVHHGVPTNPASPDREPGGSSAGSAAAVASGAADIALGTDTGGSIRVPANNCGIVGLRPTHAAISTEGVVPLAPSFDTVGLLARDLAPLRRALAVLLPEAPPSHRSPARLLVPTDLLDLVSGELATLIRSGAQRLATAHDVRIDEITLAGDELDEWFLAFRTLQGWEAWQTHGTWLERVGDVLGPGVTARFRAAAAITEADVAATAEMRERARTRVRDVVGESAILALPAAAGPALPLAAHRADKEAWRGTTLRLTCPAGLAGCPSLVVPAGSLGGSPVGIALVGPMGADRWLLEVASPLDVSTVPVDGQGVG